jgi:lipid-A-disaccharide synthase
MPSVARAAGEAMTEAGRAAPRVAIVAGERSGDHLAAALIREVHRRRADVRFAGVTGPEMRAAGCESWADIDQLSVMGVFELIPHLPRLVALKRELVARALSPRADLFVGVDFPGFNLRLASTLKAYGLPTLHYVSPQVWAWRSHRVRGMARTLDRLLCLLPFEPAFYEGRGLKAEFVGHPLADEIPLEPDRAGARAGLGLPAGATVVAVLPGSRASEIDRLAADFIGAAGWLAARRAGLVFVVPAANAAARAALEPLAAASGLAIRILDGRAREALIAADVALVASGTATLEALLCKRPMVVAYRLGAATAFLLRRLRLVRTAFFAQPNLLAGRRLVPEIFQEEVTPERLGTELLAWLDDPDRQAMVAGEFRAIHEILRRGSAARAAEALLDMLGGTSPANSCG